MVKFQSLPEESCVEIILQVAKGLDFLHSINIVHRDIKPENVLKQIGKDGKETYKITDFGLSSNREKLMTSKIGTAYYVAPEILDGRAEREGGYDKSVDVWALGYLLRCCNEV
jgi:calcium-dependent protein kinase